MKVLAVHPSPLMYTRIFLRLEPLGLELIAAALRRAGHEVRLLDLQAESQAQFHKTVARFRPDVIAFSCNYLANVPEVIDLAKAARACLPESFIFVGGHSASFVADDLLHHGDGAIDCVLKGEGEAAVVKLMEAVEHDRKALNQVPGAMSPHGEGPRPVFVENLDDLMPARDLLRHRRRYFIGVLDPAASIEFSRGCPWDCSFCSAWTFYGRSYRTVSPERAVEEMAQIKEPGVFIVDDVSFIQSKHGMAIGEAIKRKGIDKRYYLETRGDVLLRNRDVFKFWKELGIAYMFLGLEAIDDEGLRKFRKRVTLSENFEALQVARELGIQVAVNIIADPDWDAQRFETIRQFCLEIPEIVNISVNTPYPGTESWHTEKRPRISDDYRLYDIQHVVLPTRLPLHEFYAELVKTQQVLNKKHLGWAALKGTAKLSTELLMKGQTNFVKMLFKFNSVYDPKLQLADHARPVKYPMSAVKNAGKDVQNKAALYVHAPRGRKARAIDDATEQFVEATRMGTA
jgi:hopanoid C-3 methylase